jgi:hypothetical protein
MRKNKPKRSRARAIPLVGAALSLAGTAAVVGSESAAAVPSPTVVDAHELFSEEEVSDVSLATFYVFDKEEPSSSDDIELVRGGCGGCHACGGCGGCHGCGGCAHGCGCHGCGGCHGCHGCGVGGCVGIWWGGCGGCGGCTTGYWCWVNGVRVWCTY